VKPFYFYCQQGSTTCQRSNCNTNYVFPMNVEYCKCSIS